MARKRYKPEEIVSLLRQAEVLHGQGMSMADAIRQLGISEVTFYIYGRPSTSMDGPPVASDVDLSGVGQLQTSIRHHPYRGAQMGNPHAPASTVGRPLRPR